MTIYIFTTNKILFKEENEVEVKKKGIDPKTWRYDGICPHCKAELLIGYKDINMFTQQGLFKTSL